jgi:hypothetical protein
MRSRRASHGSARPLNCGVRRMRFIVIAVCSVVLFFPAFWLFEAVVGPNWGAGIAAVAMYIGFPILAMKVWPGKQAPATTMLAALEDGSLASADYDITEVVEVEESEDEGLHFLMDIGQGRTLFLSGQYLYEPVKAGRFPSTRIRVFWHAQAGLTYGVQSLGDRILPSRKLSPPSLKTVESGAFPSDRDVLGQDLGTVTEVLGGNA